MNQTVQQLPLSIEEDNSVDVTKYLEFVASNRWLIAGVALAAILFGLAYVLIVTPVYKANILVKVDDGASRPKSMPSELTAPETSQDIKTAVASEMEVLRSRIVISRAVDAGRFFLSVEPKYFPVIGEWLAHRNKKLSAPGIFGYGGYAWGAEQAKVSVFNVPEEFEGRTFVLTAEADGRFVASDEELGVEIRGAVGETAVASTSAGTFELRVDLLAAKPGAQFLVRRAARLDAVERLQESLRISERGKQSGIIEVALEGTNPKLISAILNEIGQAYVRQNVDRKSEEAEKTLAFLNAQLPEVKHELELAETKYNQLRNSRGMLDVGEEAKTALQQSLQNQARMVELKQKKEELLMRFQPQHPNVVAIDQQMASLQREIAGIESKIKKLPDFEQNVLRANREVKINTELYTALLSSAQQMRLAAESKVGRGRLLDNAVVPTKPVKPRRTTVMAFSAAVGLILGVMAAFGRKVVYGRIDAPREVEHLLGLPVTATIPHSANQERLFARFKSEKKIPAMLPLDVLSDGTVESLRRFRSSLQFSMLEAKNNIVMIAGPVPGVGKSFVSANFAAVLASIGKKVLLIDSDLRSGHLHRYFGRERTLGLADVITGKALYSNAIQKNVAENVDFLSTGELPRKPAELLSDPNFGKLLELLSTRYDFILIDTAPLLLVSDALAVASHAGAIFNVVRGGQTTASEVEEVVRRFNLAGHKVTGVIFNDAKQRPTRYGYSVQYGQYGYLASES